MSYEFLTSLLFSPSLVLSCSLCRLFEVLFVVDRRLRSGTSGECHTRFYKRRVDKQKYGTIGADMDQRSLGPFKVSRRQFALLTFTGRISVQVLEQNSTREARYKYWYDECEILVRST